MSTKLKDLIRNVRACKTAAEERAIIQKEKALIRESLSANETEYRPRNVAKLLFISMLGHDTDFGQMGCLDLITANSFAEKRIGYLGLTQLFNEKSEVLMMATNRIRIDLNNQSNYIVSLALMALSEICTAEMCRDLSGEVLKLMQNGTAYIKKKAALASTRIVSKVPEKVDDFAQKLELLLEDRHHGVLVSALQLCQHIVLISPEQKTRFNRFIPPMVRIFKSVYSTYSAEYDIGGVSDPFLQIEILKFFRIICAQNQALSDEVSEILTQVAANTNTSKNTGNAVLYECVKTIFAIESTNTLKTMGINILGKFLANKDANSRYVSLFMLQKVLKHDLQSVQKYKQTILDCLKENDISIKKLALDLLYMITNDGNVKNVVKDLQNQLLDLQDEDEFTQELTNKICNIIDKYAPTRRWYIDTSIRVLILAGNYVSEESTSALIHLVIGTPELQSYAVHKLYFSLKENLNQDGLARVTMYCLGDFGQMLLGTAYGSKIDESDIVGLIQKVVQKTNVDSIKEYALSALIKLYTKLKSQSLPIQKLIQSQISSSSLEVSKRASEYYGLLDIQWQDQVLGICQNIPACPNYKQIYENKPIGEVELDEIPVQETAEPDKQQKLDKSQKKGPDDIINIEEFIGISSEPKQQDKLDDPFNLLKIYEQPPPQNQQQQQIFDLNQIIFDSQPAQPTQQTQQTQQPQQTYQPSIQQLYQQPPPSIGNLLDGFNFNPQPVNVPQLNPQQNPQQNQLLFQQLNLSQITIPQNNQQVPQVPQIPQYQQATSPVIQAAPVQPVQNNFVFTAFEDESIEIIFTATKEQQPEITNINVSFNNKSQFPLTDLQFHVAVIKHLKLQLTAPTYAVIQPNSKGTVTQKLIVTNSLQGFKGIVMKLKINYAINGQQITREQTCNKFPTDY